MLNFSNITKPIHEHDCSRCLFLGTHKSHDLYFCEQSGHPTVIARYSSKGSEYISGVEFGKMAIEEGDFDKPIAQAYMRAKTIGLL